MMLMIVVLSIFQQYLSHIKELQWKALSTKVLYSHKMNIVSSKIQLMTSWSEDRSANASVRF